MCDCLGDFGDFEGDVGKKVGAGFEDGGAAGFEDELEVLEGREGALDALVVDQAVTDEEGWEDEGIDKGIAIRCGPR